MTPKTILLVEDHEDNRNVYRTILHHFGYRVVEAPDGREGIRLARERLPDLILMDVGIPYIDGCDATRMLKADPQTRAIPVIALTAYARPEDRQQAADAGCDGFLAKPVDPRSVVAEIERFLGAAEPTGGVS